MTLPFCILVLFDGLAIALLCFSMFQVAIFFFSFFQAANPNKISDDLIESFRDDFRAGRSVNVEDKTLEKFCTDANIDVRKSSFVSNPLVTFSGKTLVDAYA